MAAPTPQANPGAGLPPAVYAKHIPEFLLFGDSITQRAHNIWSNLLADWGSRRFDVRVKGYGGYNSNFAIPVMDDLIRLGVWRKPRLVTICFGANDCANDADPNGHRVHVPVEKFYANICKLVAMAKDQKCIGEDGKTEREPDIVLITQPPINNAEAHDRTFESAQAYSDAMVRAGQEMGVTTINLFAEMVKQGDRWKGFLDDDGIHLSKAGGAFLVELLKPVITRLCPKLSDNSDPAFVEFPDWSVLDPVHYDEQLAIVTTFPSNPTE